MKDKAGVISEVFFFSPLWFEKHSLPSKGLPDPAPASLLTWMFQGPLTSGCAALEFPALLGFQKVESQRRKCLGDPRKGCGVPGEFYQVSGRQGWVQADFPGDAHPSRCYVRFIIPAHPVLSTSNSSQAFDLVHLVEGLCTSGSWQPQLPASAWAPPTLTLSLQPCWGSGLFLISPILVCIPTHLSSASKEALCYLIQSPQQPSNHSHFIDRESEKLSCYCWSGTWTHTRQLHSPCTPRACLCFLSLSTVFLF